MYGVAELDIFAQKAVPTCYTYFSHSFFFPFVLQVDDIQAFKSQKRIETLKKHT